MNVARIFQSPYVEHRMKKPIKPAQIKKSRIHIFQCDFQKLRVQSPWLAQDLDDDVVVGASIAQAIAFYRHAWTVDAIGSGDNAVEYARDVARNLTATPRTLVSRIATARVAAKSDLFIIEHGEAYLLADDTFMPYFGPRPAGFGATSLTV